MPGAEGSGGAEQTYNGVAGPDGIAHAISYNTSPIVSGNSPMGFGGAPQMH